MARTNRKPTVFIPHIAEEKEIAIAFQEIIRNAFADLVEPFVSSSKQSIPIGDEWLAKLKEGLRNCDLAVIFASKRSVGQPWINFEAGSVWGRNKPVILLCHSGLTIDELDYPLRMLQVGLATSEDRLQETIERIAAGCGGRAPTVDFAPFIGKLLEFERVSEQAEQFADKNPVGALHGLQSYEVQILVAVANESNGPEGTPLSQLRQIGETVGLRPAPTNLGFQMLKRKEFVEVYEVRDWNDNWDAVRLTDAGWNWLAANHEVLQVEYKPLERPNPTQNSAHTAAAISTPNDDLPF